jgi:hypothetical protein
MRIRDWTLYSDTDMVQILNVKTYMQITHSVFKTMLYIVRFIHSAPLFSHCFSSLVVYLS